MKKLLPILCLTAAAIAFSSTAFAYKGDIAFSDGEAFNHSRDVNKIIETAADCLQQDLNRHNSFIKQYGISSFYGENSSFAKKKGINEMNGLEETMATTNEDKRQMLREAGIPENLVQQFIPNRKCNSLQDCPLQMQPTSCIGITLKCLGRGFQAAGEGEVWTRIRAFVRANDVTGDALQYALMGLGWKNVYWNPNTERAAAWDAQERASYPGNPKGIWGRHVTTLDQVMNEGRYGRNPVDDAQSMVNFGTKTPEFIKKVPFFVGIAHQGYHVFSGSYGQIVEGHSTRAIHDGQTLETSQFNPLVKGGGPRGGPYKTGTVAVPPGFVR